MDNEPPKDATEPKTATSEFEKLADLITGAFKEGGDAGTNAASGSANQFREVIEKGIYDISYGVAYGLAYGATTAKDSIFKQAEAGAKEGAAAGSEAAREEQDRPDEGAAPSPV